MKKNLRPTWDKEQISQFLDYLKETNKDWYFICSVALLTGMRVGEQIALKWSDISFTERLIRITESYCPKSKIYGPTKARKSRVIPINGQLEEILKLLESLKIEHNPYVLPRPAGFICSQPSRWLAKICEKLGLPIVHYHDLRGMFAQRAAFSGVPIHALQAICGWEDMATAQKYMRIAGKDLVGLTDNMRV